MPFTNVTEPVHALVRTDEFVLRPIAVGDTELDYAAVMETREHLRLWRQATWPEDDFTVEANREDLAGMEERHAAGRAFSYTVLDPAGTECLGCVYVFATDAKFLASCAVNPVGDDRWADVDAVVFFWVRLSRMDAGMDERLLAALRTWFGEQWRFERPVFATSASFTQQAELLDRGGLARKFELDELGKPGKWLVFG